MADFVAVLRRAIDSLETNTPETRAALYDKARAALLGQLRALDPPISDEDLAQQAETLDLAIARLEEEYAGQTEEEAPAEDAAAAVEEPGDEASEEPAEGTEDTEDEEDEAPTPPPASGPTSRAGPAASAAVASAAGSAAASGASTPSQPARAPQPADQRPPQQSQAPRPPQGQGPRPEGPSQGPGAPVRPSQPSQPQQPQRARDGQYAGEEAAARSRASAAAYEAENGAPPPRRRGRAALWGVAAVLLLALALFGLWQSDLIFSTADQTLDEIASDETKIDDRLPGDEAAPEGAQSEFEAPPAEPEQQAETPAAETPAAEDPAEPEAEQVVPPPATAEQPSLTDQPTPPGASAQALLIEEASGGPGSANTLGGSVQWELVSEDEAQGPAQVISGTVTIPDRDLNLMITIRKNSDPDLPASHTVELVFDVPQDFAGGGIANVPGMIMKATPRSTGQPLVGAVVPVTENFLLVGLSEGDLDRQRNVSEMRQRDFIDLPLVYENGGRAVLSIAKGEEGQQVFNQAFEAWQQ